MKTYNQLTEDQKTEAFNKRLSNLLEMIIEGAIVFNDNENEDDLQARINTAWEKANRMQTPWFIGEYIMDTCSEEIKGMVQCDIEEALYPEQNEFCIQGIA